MLNENQVDTIRHNFQRMISAVKWVISSIISGLVIGAVGTLFSFLLAFVTNLRLSHPWLVYLLPIGGVIIVGCYHLLRNQGDTGTNLVISSINAGDRLSFRMAQLIFVSTLITHLCGGSAGREGAALQLGGSVGNGIGQLFRFDEKDKQVMTMCGMSAAFSALFGTPMAAAIFPIEVISVGIMHYSVLVPCVIASLAAHAIATMAGIAPETFVIAQIPDFTVVCISTILKILFCGYLWVAAL